MLTMLMFVVFWCVVGAWSYPTNKDWSKWYWTRVVLYLVVVGCTARFFHLPNYADPWWYIYPTAGLLLFTAVCRVLPLIGDSGSNDNESNLRGGTGLLQIAVVLGVICLLEGYTLDFFHAKHLSTYLGEVEEKPWELDHSPTDTKRIRTVGIEQAQWAGSKELGTSSASEKDGTEMVLASRYKPGDYSIQEVRGKLVWVAPLEFIAWQHWVATGASPGYVTVDAHDFKTVAKVVLTGSDEKPLQMRYMPSAFFGWNLHRHLWNNGYKGYAFSDTHFELDDDLRPYYVVTATDPTISYRNHTVRKILIVDPQTGKFEEYSRENLPEWVNRAEPEDLAERYIQTWGQYRQGWMNSAFSREGVLTNTVDGNLRLVFDEKGKCAWSTGLTGIGATDSIMSIMMVDSRTGKATKYKIGGISEHAVVQLVNAAVANFKTWKCTQPVPYNLYGHLAWVAPVVSEEGISQQLAIVRADTKEVCLGDTLDDALLKYKGLLSSSLSTSVPGSSATEKTIEFTVERRANDARSGQIMLWSSEVGGKAFSGDRSTSVELLFTKEGDRVRISFAETGSKIESIGKFNNLSLPIEKE